MPPQRYYSRVGKAAVLDQENTFKGDTVNDEDAHSSDEESSDGEPIIPLLATRGRRQNAGNRMAALLEDEAQAEVEEMFKEEENDVEFQAKFEEDVFDSDFGSTDSAPDEEDDDEAGEKQLQREAKAAAKGKGKTKKGYTSFLPSFARQTKHQQKSSALASTSATTLDGVSTPGQDGDTPVSDPAPPKKRRRGFPAGIDPEFLVPQRESSRRSAVAFKESVEGRLKESEQRRATLTKPARKQRRRFTQADLIAEALETEEVNRASLLAFYAAEEDRRAAERVLGMRYEIIGPKVSFLSRKEGIGEDGVTKSPMQTKGKGKAVKGIDVEFKKESGRRRMIEVLGEAGKADWTPGDEQGLAAAKEAAEKEGANREKTKHTISSRIRHGPTQVSSGAGDVIDAPAGSRPKNAMKGHVGTDLDGTPQLNASHLTPVRFTNRQTPSEVALESVYACNYLVFDDFVGATPAQEMEALFGDHCDWSLSKSAILKANRPLKTCPITGEPARYRDPRTLTPYANKQAYDILSCLSTLSSTTPSFYWNETLGAFTGVSGAGKLQSLVGSGEASTGVVHGTIDDDPLSHHQRGGGKVQTKSAGYMGAGGRNAKKRENEEA